MDETPNLNLSYIMAAQAQKHVTHNEAIRDLDAIVHLSVLDRDLTAPPGSPSDGDRFMVATGGTGEWAGKDGRVAAWQDGAWAFHSPREGWVCWIADEDILQAYDGSGWGNAVGSTLQNLSMLGINTAADTTNRLSVVTPAVLFSNESGDIQTKLNKAAMGDTASFLFQTNWSGRAEMGLTGDDDFHFKVSPDGTNWHEAAIVLKDTGYWDIPRLHSGKITILHDSVGEIITPGAGGFVLISWVNPTYPQSAFSGILSYDTGASLTLTTIATADAMTNQGTTVLSGTTGPDGKINVAVKSGSLVLEHRSASTGVYSYTFLGGY